MSVRDWTYKAWSDIKKRTAIWSKDMRMLASAKGRAVFLKLHMPVRDWTNKCLSETGQTSRRAKGSQSHKSYESQKLGSRAASSSSSPLLLLPLNKTMAGSTSRAQLLRLLSGPAGSLAASNFSSAAWRLVTAALTATKSNRSYLF